MSSVRVELTAPQLLALIGAVVEYEANHDPDELNDPHPPTPGQRRALRNAGDKLAAAYADATAQTGVPR
jgi:hypothetical protein